MTVSYNSNHASATGTVIPTAARGTLDVNAMVFPPEDETLRQELLRILQNERTHFGCLGVQLKPIQDFVKNPQNINGIKESIAFYGMPKENRQAVRRLFGWADFCDYESIALFYIYAKLAIKFPKLPKTPQSCNQLKSLKLALQNEKVNKGAYFIEPAFDNYFNVALEAKISEYENLYATLVCDEVIMNQQQAAAAAASAKAAEAAAKAQVNAFNEVTKSGVSNVGIWVMGGVAALIAIIVGVRVLKKN